MFRDAGPFWVKYSVAPNGSDVNVKSIFVEELLINTGSIDDFFDSRQEPSSYFVSIHFFDVPLFLCSKSEARVCHSLAGAKSQACLHWGLSLITT